MSKKLADRRKYVENGSNEYSAPKEKPPRQDLRRRHNTLDESDDGDNSTQEDKDMKVSEIAKKLARKKLAANQNAESAREGMSGFRFKEKGIKSIANTYRNLAQAFMFLIKANNTFSSCKSSQISPDGKLGGKGYVLPIKDIRNIMGQTTNALSELIDTFHDEVNSPYWKKTTVEHHQSVMDILEEAEDLVDKAEDEEKEKEEIKEAESNSLSDVEKEKVKNILLKKKW